jgi:hypothetical protein
MLKALAASAVAALALVGLALAAPQKDTYNLTANLKARSEVPRPTGVPVGATGLFTGKAVELANDKAKLTWRLTFAKLSGAAGAAHIHAGKVGKAGPVMVALCGPCRSGQRGTATLTHAQFAKIEAGATYVNVHTAKNAGGEIRGQVRVSEAG